MNNWFVESKGFIFCRPGELPKHQSHSTHAPFAEEISLSWFTVPLLPGPLKLVFLTMTMEAEVAAEAFRRGASAYVLKQSAGDELVLAIRKVNQGASYLSPLIAKETVMYLLNQGEKFNEEKHLTDRPSAEISAKFHYCDKK
jgi:hypothetical protein